MPESYKSILKYKQMRFKYLNLKKNETIYVFDIICVCDVCVINRWNPLEPSKISYEFSTLWTLCSY